jgi:hypothetical protein
LIRAEEEVDQCTGCILTDSISDPWSCSNCMAVIGLNVADEAERLEQRASCFDCLTDNPYNSNLNYSNYAWACGQCAGLGEGAIRVECYKCIRWALLWPARGAQSFCASFSHAAHPLTCSCAATRRASSPHL